MTDRMKSDEWYGVGKIQKDFLLDKGDPGCSVINIYVSVPGNHLPNTDYQHDKLVDDTHSIYPMRYVREFKSEMFLGLGGYGKRCDPHSAEKATGAIASCVFDLRPVDENGWPDMSDEALCRLFTEIASRFACNTLDDSATRERMIKERDAEFVRNAENAESREAGCGAEYAERLIRSFPSLSHEAMQKAVRRGMLKRTCSATLRAAMRDPETSEAA